MYELSLISLLALCLVSFIGVPHGSFDGAVAALLGYRTKKDFFIFVTLYLIISAAVIVFWIYFPIVSLLLFIFMSVIHFGLCDWYYLELRKYKWSAIRGIAGVGAFALSTKLISIPLLNFLIGLIAATIVKKVVKSLRLFEYMQYLRNLRIYLPYIKSQISRRDFIKLDIFKYKPV